MSMAEDNVTDNKEMSLIIRKLICIVNSEPLL